MQKWQQKQRQKYHQSIIQNAKSSLKRYSNSRQKPLNASRTKPLPLQNKQQLPLNKILQIFHLEQYASVLNTYRFIHNLSQLDSNNYDLSQMLLHVEQGDRQRFQSLLHTLIVMSKNMNLNTNDKIIKAKQPSKASIYCPPVPNSTQSNKTPNSIPKSNNSQSKFRIKVKNGNNFQRTPKMERKTKQQPITTKINISKQLQMYSNKTKTRRKSISHATNSKGKASDDVTLIHNFQLNDKESDGYICKIQTSNNIIRRLTQKIQTLGHSLNEAKSPENINLELKKIQKMYLSFDSATLTSNITNIDLQQLIQCFALQIKNLLNNYEVQMLAQTNQDKIKSLLKQSFIVVREQQKQSKMEDDSYNQVQTNYEKQKFQQQNNNNLNVQQSIEQSIQQSNLNFNHEAPIQTPNDQYQKSDSQSQNPQNLQIKLREYEKEVGMASSIWGNNYIASVINDFSCFDNLHEQSIKQTNPQVEDIKNFVQLIVTAGKMQKQIPILAYIYIKRLIKSVAGSKITPKNWQNIVLITLIQASKIWDDRSLENHSFSKILKPYTTLQLNRLQKYLLFFIDYNLKVDQKQYSQGYFELRKHSGQPYHTVNLVKLDLKTIAKLQNLQDYQQKDKIEKIQFLKKCMNKSF